MQDEPSTVEPEPAREEQARPRRRRSVALLELLANSASAVQRQGIAPFALALVILAPTALVAIAIESWFSVPGSLLLVGLLMPAFALYLAAVTPMLVDGEASARNRSLASTIDHADASLPALMIGGAVVGVAVAAALELRLLPGFLILGLLALTAPAALREQLGPIASLGRGLGLTQGNAIAFAVLGAIIGAAALGIYAVLAFVLGPLPGFLGELLAVAVAATLAAPVAAHVFVTAFDRRADGRRLALRAAHGAPARNAGALGRGALQRTLGSLGQTRSRAAQRVSFTSRTNPEASPLRYSADAASQTVRVAAARRDPMAAPAWAQTVEEATVEELHSAV